MVKKQKHRTAHPKSQQKQEHTSDTRPQDTKISIDYSLERKSHPEGSTQTIYTHCNIVYQHNISIPSTDKHTRLLQI